MVNAKFEYLPNEKQYKFHTSAAKNKLYGGAKGGGKSHALRMDAVNTALSAPNLHIIIFRRTYPMLLSSVITPLIEQLPKGTYEQNKSEKWIRFKKTNSYIHFWHVQHERDVINYQGSEFDVIYFDELTQFTEYQFKYLKGCLRTTKNYINPFVAASANPGGIGHTFVKRLWIDNDRDINEEKETWEFIAALVYDNEHIMTHDADYVARLEALPEDEKKALLYGDWNVFKGQYFKEYRSDIHEITPVELAPEYKRIIALDYGYTNPSAVLWLVEDRDGNVFCYRELYVTKYSYEELLEEIIDIEFVRDLVADPALRAKDPSTHESFFDIALKLKFNIIPGNNDRIPGWQLLRKLLKPYEDHKQWPKAPLQIFKNCENLIRTLPALIYDERKVEDVNTQGEDHAPDALRYWLNYLKNKPKSIKEVKQINTKAKRKSRRVISMDF